MNSKLLYAATVAMALISTLAMAGQAAASNAPLTGAEVKADVLKAAVNGTLQRTEHGPATPDTRFVSTLSRAEVYTELAAAKASRKGLIGPERSETYKPFGPEIGFASTPTRAEVKADVVQAAVHGTLRHTDCDESVMVGARANANVTPSKLAKRVKPFFKRTDA